ADPNAGQDVPPPETDPSGINLTVPASDDCGSDYLPVGVEVRVSGRKSIDIDTPTCAQLVARKFVDCWSYISTIRTWRTSNSPEFHNVTLAGGTCSQDAYFSR